MARLAEVEEDLAIATVPRDEVARGHGAPLPLQADGRRPHAVPVLITYALVGRFQMIDLEVDRSLVRKLLAQGFDVYFVDWGTPGRAQRWLNIDDYVSGYSTAASTSFASWRGKINLLGICQGSVFTACYAALFRKGRNLVTVTPIDFHGDMRDPQTGSGYMNQWARALTRKTSTSSSVYGCARQLVGFAFLMMNRSPT
jgi:polyhydroxyalkanoate synthase